LTSRQGMMRLVNMYEFSESQMEVEIGKKKKIEKEIE
jgi:hypothetical protein